MNAFRQLYCLVVGLFLLLALIFIWIGGGSGHEFQWTWGTFEYMTVFYDFTFETGQKMKGFEIHPLGLAMTLAATAAAIVIAWYLISRVRQKKDAPA